MALPAASFPATLVTSVTLTEQTDGTSVVDAADVNLPYSEIIAIEGELGVAPATRAGAWGSGSFNTSTQAYGTVDSRIKNVENGTYLSVNALNFSGTVATIHGGTSAAF